MSATIAARRDAGGGLVLVTLAIDAARAAAYDAPGQYVEVTTSKGSGYFVLAGDVGAPSWELLVRNAGDAADALVSSPVGAHVDVSSPLGHGFPVERARRGWLVVAVVGSALAVARPVLRRRIAEGDAKTTCVFLGTRTPTDLPLDDEVEAWTRAGAGVVLCLSGGELDRDRDVVPDAARVSGYAQHAVARAVDEGRIPRGAMIVAAGPEGMLTDMRELGRAGVVEVVTNV